MADGINHHEPVDCMCSGRLRNITLRLGLDSRADGKRARNARLVKNCEKSLTEQFGFYLGRWDGRRGMVTLIVAILGRMGRKAVWRW